MANIIHRVGIKAPVAKVYAALTTIDGLSQWWTKETTGGSEPGGTIHFTFRDPGQNVKGRMGMEVMKLEPNESVRWRCQEGPEEWIGTDITFDLTQEGEFTILLFGHRNWKEVSEFTAHCSMKWAVFMLSLRDLVETGRGRPSPDDVKIDNWN